MSLEPYIKVYDDFLSSNECEDLYKNVEWESHTWTDQQGNVIRKDNDLYVSNIENNHNYLYERLGEAAKKYFNEAHMSEPLITRSSVCRLNRYEKDQFMAPHSDLIRSLFDGNEKGVPVLSSIIMLNDSFEGGELVFNFKLENKKFTPKLKKGSIIIWPATFLYEHEVTPIIEGERISMVTWFW